MWVLTLNFLPVTYFAYTGKKKKTRFTGFVSRKTNETLASRNARKTSRIKQKWL